MKREEKIRKIIIGLKDTEKMQEFSCECGYLFVEEGLTYNAYKDGLLPKMTINKFTFNCAKCGRGYNVIRAVGENGKLTPWKKNSITKLN